jgi:hypothetical protein
MMQILRRMALTGVVLAALMSPAQAQQRPLVTEDPETVGAGVILIEGGFDYGRDMFFPASGLRGNLLRLPLLGVSFGISSIAEIQIDGGLRNRLAITARQDAPLAHLLDVVGDTTTDVEDLVVATKVRIVSEQEGRPAVGLRLATRLPNAGNESGLGLDTTDFFASLLIGKTVESIRVVGNVGLGILGNPVVGHQQNDVLTFGISFARAVVQGVEVVGELNGHVNTREGEPAPGTENRAMMRFGSRYTWGPGRIDGAILIGMTGRDPDFGVTAGFTYVFRAFQVP